MGESREEKSSVDASIVKRVLKVERESEQTILYNRRACEERLTSTRLRTDNLLQEARRKIVVAERRLQELITHTKKQINIEYEHSTFLKLSEIEALAIKNRALTIDHILRLIENNES